MLKNIPCIILKQGLVERSKIVQHVFEKNHKIKFDNTTTLKTENMKYREHKEAAHMAFAKPTFSHPHIDFSPIWVSIIM
jgi:hypothetical protein